MSGGKPSFRYDPKGGTFEENRNDDFEFDPYAAEAIAALIIPPLIVYWSAKELWRRHVVE